MLRERTLTRKQLVSFFFLGLLIFIVFNVLWILSPFFIPLFWASVLAFAFYPVYGRLVRATGGRETLSAALLTIAILLVVLPAATLILFSLTDELMKFYKWILSYVDDGGFRRLVEDIRSIPAVQTIEAQLVRSHILKEDPQQVLMNQAANAAEFVAKSLGHLTKNILRFVLNFFLAFFLLFFLFKDGERIYRFIYETTPLEEKNKRDIFRQLNETFNAVLRGQFLTSFVQSVAAGILFWLFGLPMPLLLGVMTFLVSMIPILGAAAVWLPSAGYLLVIGESSKAAALFLAGVFGISLIDNLLKPLLIGEKTKLPYFLLFLGILGGIRVYGLVGIFVAPAVLSVFFVLVKIYREKFLEDRS